MSFVAIGYFLTMKLEEMLKKKQPKLEEAIQEAEAELAELRRQAAELQSLIIRGRAALGQDGRIAQAAPAGSMTLHEAMLTALLEAYGGMPAKDLAAVINERHLYEMRDGRNVEAGQVHARVRNYGHLFVKDGSLVKPRHELKTAMLPSTGAFWEAVTEVRDPDGGVMHVGARVAFQSRLALRPGEKPEDFTARAAEQRAVSILAKGRFEDGATDTALLSSFGWRPVFDLGPTEGDATADG